MTTFEKSANPPGLKNSPASRDGKPNLIVGRVDLIAVLITLLCLCLFGFLVAAMAVVQFAELISSLWSDSFDRWLIVVFGVAIVWVAARWKKLCVF
jgi:hypothetical protein